MPLQASDVAFAYAQGRHVLRGLSAAIHPARVTAIIGPNGSGKSTLLRLFLGLLTPGTGLVALDKAPVASLSERRRALRLAYVPQQASVALAFSVVDVVALGRYALPGDALPPAMAALDRVALADMAHVPFATLSAGQRQRAVLARALAQLDQPPGPERFLLADEPFSAMDPRHALASAALVRAIADSGVGVAIVLHDLAVVQAIADDVLLLSPGGGAILADALDPDTLARVFETPFLRWTTDDGRSMLHSAPAR